MKKIKGLLLFGILTLLGIGNSFSQFYDLNDSDGSNLIIPSITYRSGWPSDDNYIDINYTYGDSVYSSTTFLFNRFFQNNHLSIGACYNSNGIIKGFSSNSVSFGDNSDCSSSSVIINANGGNPFNYIYMSSSTPISPYSERSVGSLNSYMYFDSTTFYTNYGYINDVPSGYTRQNIFLNNAGNYGIVSNDGVGNLLLTSIGQDSFNITENGGVYDFNLSVYSGYLILHFNTYSGTYYVGNSTIVLSLGSGEIIFNYYTGFYGGINEISDNNILPRYVGYLTYNNSTGEAYNMFINNVLNKGSFILTNGSYIGGIIFTSYSYSNPSYGSDMPRPLLTSTTTTQFSFLTDDNVPTIIIPTGNGNQSFPDPIFDGGVFDANIYLIEESIKCYLTSGEVCNSPFTLENSTNYVNNYDHEERVRNSTDKTGYLTFNNSVDMLSQYCLNVDTIQYAFCSQLYLYEGSPITYYYNNGYFNYIISGSGWEVNLGSLWSGQLGYAYCEGPYCSEFNQGLPQFIKKDTGYYSEFGFSGEYVSLDFFKNYFDNGFFFQCPFSYSGSYFTIGSKLIDRLDQHDPLKPINCFISAFSHGIKSSFFGDSKLGLSHSGVLMSNTGPNATRFYTFLDIVLSLGYIFLFSKLFKFLKKH